MHSRLHPFICFVLKHFWTLRSFWNCLWWEYKDSDIWCLFQSTLQSSVMEVCEWPKLTRVKWQPITVLTEETVAQASPGWQEGLLGGGICRPKVWRLRVSSGCETGGKVPGRRATCGYKQNRSLERWKQRERGRHGEATCLSLFMLVQHVNQGLPTLDPEITTSCFLCKAEPTQNIIKWAIWRLQREETHEMPFQWQEWDCSHSHMTSHFLSVSSSVQTVMKQALEKLTLVKYCSPIPASQELFTCFSWVSYPTGRCSWALRTPSIFMWSLGDFDPQ